LCRQAPQHADAAHHRLLRRLMMHLDERQRRLLAGLEALRLGHGGTRLVAQITELDEKTVRRGRREVTDANSSPLGRVRRAGAGRPKAEKNSLALSSG